MAKKIMINGNQQRQNYTCVFFDLDHTLWDYETNSKETLSELYVDYNLKARGIPDVESLYLQFRKVNFELWDLYDRELIDHAFIRVERFKRILESFSAYEEALSDQLSVDYLSRCPHKGNLMPFAREVLDYLSQKYSLTIVTNGFEEIQNIKLNSGNIHHYFKHIVTSQQAGHRKPSSRIFDYALLANAVKCCDVVMIGDNLVTDIAGARGSSITTVFFNPEKVKHNDTVDHEISCLSELKEFL